MRNFLYLIIAFLVSYEAKIANDVVTVSKREILVNNEPYTIKGICYHPVPKGSNQRNFKTIDQDLAGLQIPAVEHPGHVLRKEIDGPPLMRYRSARTR